MPTASSDRPISDKVTGDKMTCNTPSTIRRKQWLVGGATIALVLVALLMPLPVLGAEPQERHVNITARSFAFEPGTVRVNRGDTVIISLESTDVVHGLYVDGYGGSVVAEPGRPSTFSFVADRSGAFRFRCSISCGSLHPFMIGKLVVEPNLIFGRAIAATVIVAVGAILTFWHR